MSLLKKLFESKGASTLTQYLAEALIKRKQKIEAVMNETDDLELPDFQLPTPNEVRGEFAYMLFPDDDNDLTEDGKISRRKRPFSNLVSSLNKNIEYNTIEKLDKWPSAYKRHKLTD